MLSDPTEYDSHYSDQCQIMYFRLQPSKSFPGTYSSKQILTYQKKEGKKGKKKRSEAYSEVKGPRITNGSPTIENGSLFLCNQNMFSGSSLWLFIDATVIISLSD